MSSVRQQLPATVRALLIAAQTSAGANVYLWRDWSLDPSKFPAVVLRARRAERADLTHGNGIPNYMATVWLEAECMTAVDGVDPTAAEATAETLAESEVIPMLNALIIGPPQTFKRISSIVDEIEVKADGETHVATARILAGFEYEEQYGPALTTLLQQMVVVALKPDITAPELAAITAALNEGASDATIAALAGVLAGADFTIPSS